jgi:hypothetical protein
VQVEMAGMAFPALLVLLAVAAVVEDKVVNSVF